MDPFDDPVKPRIAQMLAEALEHRLTRENKTPEDFCKKYFRNDGIAVYPKELRELLKKKKFPTSWKPAKTLRLILAFYARIPGESFEALDPRLKLEIVQKLFDEEKAKPFPVPEEESETPAPIELPAVPGVSRNVDWPHIRSKLNILFHKLQVMNFPVVLTQKVIDSMPPGDPLRDDIDLLSDLITTILNKPGVLVTDRPTSPFLPYILRECEMNECPTREPRRRPRKSGPRDGDAPDSQAR